MRDELDSGSVEPSSKRYVVTVAHEHKTLRVGDVVVMVESPTTDNWLLREQDFTLHRLMDEHDQYVHMTIWSV